MVSGRVLVIAGSDSSGGAGLEADQKVIAAHGCYAMTATTALTAQNTTGVSAIHTIPPAFLRKQIDAVFDDMGVDVVKTGMLAGAETVSAVVAALEGRDFGALVVDPVMIATTGAELLPHTALREMRERLLPRATVVTPNVPEARMLLADAGVGEVVVKSVEDLEVVGAKLLTLGMEWVLVKGGHVPFRKDQSIARTVEEREIVVDVLMGKRGERVRMETGWKDSTSTHGTGCSLASAIASNLAKGLDVQGAVRAACRYVEAGIRTAPGFGKGNGPLNHFHSTQTLPFVPDRFVEWMLERPDVAPVWDRFVNHPFVMAMGNGTLPLESFKGYLVQDYLYLIHFARANALAAYKSKNMADIAAAAGIVLHIDRETNLHLTYCEGFGLSREDMEKTDEKMACTAYTRYVLDIGQSEDWLALQTALAPCLLGYGAVAKMLHGHVNTKKEGNHYWNWIENYVADDYVQAVKTGSDMLERNAVLQSPSRIEQLVKIFIHATKMEIGFWEMFPYQ
ncbi:trifunctional hydroxymethylpyrimidine kinase/phosphomethylpyrimidine kinase/thiaminase [Gnomoniopsis smithogilvyi]|uniref:Trifunctional hydroxymethylpyrimidine kinase/phosphomethylpyrimidine kinase/thiaminase n=1 Tax=Gnomoniopsis smithogilvyi TaxID=1191159 RepID=A0A9W8YT95_9PEZI|nr:trifunctional hydroxymethylpyrimidine kinase/phosphomethylpyrimidine kinase/thiaminase [Gnomoniopsis smithogilvyi]